ncbi:MAG: zinc ribbon domain-containing protein [Clostridia bacterium]|nr:zinc ribbon domain-containing protein [Clostridia bacterium]
MAFCSNCGKAMSPGAAFCPGCGAKAGDKSQSESKVIVYGITQKFLIGGTLKIYADGVLLGEVKKNEKAEFPIARDCVITAKCGVNPVKEKTKVKGGIITVIKYEYDRISSSFIAHVSEYV